MKCPNCAADMETDREHRDWACPSCGLAGPADVLRNLTPRARKLTAAEIAQLMEYAGSALAAPEMTPERADELEQDETAAQRALRELGKEQGHG